jgi:hypothetical protein
MKLAKCLRRGGSILAAALDASALWRAIIAKYRGENKSTE